MGRFNEPLRPYAFKSLLAAVSDAVPMKHLAADVGVNLWSVAASCAEWRLSR